MASENDKKGLAVVRSAESRLVWLLSYLVVSTTEHADDAANRADKALDAYQERFPALSPADLPE